MERIEIEGKRRRKQKESRRERKRKEKQSHTRHARQLEVRERTNNFYSLLCSLVACHTTLHNCCQREMKKEEETLLEGKES